MMGTLADITHENGLLTDGDWVEKKDQDPKGNISLIQLADIKDGFFKRKSARFLNEKNAAQLNCTFLRKGDVLVARLPDPLGRACVYPSEEKKAVTAVDVCIVRVDEEKYNNKWLVYSINSPYFRKEISKLESGTTRKRISKKNLSSIQFPIPKKKAQDAMVSAVETQFTRLDAVASSLKKIKAKIDVYRKGVLNYAFSGILSQEWRKNNPDAKQVSLNDIQTQRWKIWLSKQHNHNQQLPFEKWKDKFIVPSDKLSASELPLRWVHININEAFDVYVGATPSRFKKEYWNGEIAWASSGEVAFCSIYDTRETITQEGLNNTSTTIHPIGTVLLGMIGEGKTRGQCAILEIEACNSQNSAAIRVSEVGQVPKYLYYYLYFVYEKNRRLGSGNNQPALNKRRVQMINIPLPPLDEQKIIVQEIESCFSVIDKVEEVIDNSLRKAERLRRSILKAAFEGKLVN